MPGYELDRFVNLSESEKEEYTCSICQDIFSCPVVAPCCLQTFCQDCIQQWIREHKMCPFDRKELNEDQLIPAPRALTNMLGRLKIHCDYYDKGCNEIISLEKLQQHLASCFYSGECVTCNKCMCEISKNHDCIKSLLEARERDAIIIESQRKQLDQLNIEKDNFLQTIQEMTNSASYGLPGGSHATHSQAVCRMISLMPNVSPEHKELINRLKEREIIKSFRVEQTMLAVDRILFCPDSYTNTSKSIGFGATMSAPHIHAITLELLASKLVEGAKVLDIGSGSGYLTVCMALMVGRSGRVVGIDHVPELIQKSTQIVETNYPSLLESDSIKFISADGRKGYIYESPYDVINVGGAVEHIPEKLKGQLKFGGRLVAPIFSSHKNNQQLLVLNKLTYRNIKKYEDFLGSFENMTDLQTQLS